MTCREFTEFLHEYLLGNLPAGQRAEFDKHLAECPECVAYLDGYRKAIQLAKEALSVPDDVPPPAEAPEELVRAVLRARAGAS
jgi:anti-sigma factor RsiW